MDLEVDVDTITNVSVDGLLKTQPKFENSAEICIRLLADTRVTGDNVLKCWSTRLFEYYGLSACTNKLLESLLESILKYITKVLNDQAKDEIFQNECIFEYLSHWRNIYMWISTNIKDFNIYNLSIFIENALKTLELILSYSTKRKSANSAKIFKESLQLQALISSTISGNFSIFTCQVESCMEIIIKITTLLCGIEKYIVMLNIKSAANLWKQITRLYIANAEFYRNNFEIDFKWIKTPVILLCEEINKSVKLIYDYNTYNEDTLIRILKINEFYIKCLQMLATEFSHNYFHGCFQLVETIHLVLNMPPNVTVINKAYIEKYLTVGLLNILNLIYKNENFANKVLEDKTFNTPKECANFCEIILEILKVLCQNGDEETVNLYLGNKMMDKLFRYIPNSRELFYNQNSRKEFVGIVASLFLQYFKSIKVKEVFENVLTNGVLQNDFLLANISIDVILVVVRFITAAERYRYFKFWVNINEKFSKFSDSLQALYTEYLMTSLYELLPNNYKTKIWSLYFSQDIFNDKRTLLTLGINRILDETQKRIHKNKLEAELYRSIRFSVDKSIDNYYRVIEIMKLLSESEIENTFLAHSLLQYWPLLSMDINLQKHDLFFRILFKCCSKNMVIFNDSQLDAILILIEKYACFVKSSDNTLLNLQLYDFLTEVEKNRVTLKDKANNIQLLLKNNPENSLIMYLRLENNLPSTSKGLFSIISDFEHICEISESSENYPVKTSWQNKKIRLDGRREVIKEAVESAEQIEQYFKYEKPQSLDIDAIREIISIYGRIINNNN